MNDFEEHFDRLLKGSWIVGHPQVKHLPLIDQLHAGVEAMREIEDLDSQYPETYAERMQPSRQDQADYSKLDIARRLH